MNHTWFHLANYPSCHWVIVILKTILEIANIATTKISEQVILKTKPKQ